MAFGYGEEFDYGEGEYYKGESPTIVDETIPQEEQAVELLLEQYKKEYVNG